MGFGRLTRLEVIEKKGNIGGGFFGDSVTRFFEGWELKDVLPGKPMSRAAAACVNLRRRILDQSQSGVEDIRHPRMLNYRRVYQSVGNV